MANYYYGHTHIFTDNTGSSVINLDTIDGDLIYDSDVNEQLTISSTGITISNLVEVLGTLTGLTSTNASAEFEDINISTCSNTTSFETINCVVTSANVTSVQSTNITATNVSSSTLSTGSMNISSCTMDSPVVTNATVTNVTFSSASNVTTTNTGANSVSSTLTVLGLLKHVPVTGRMIYGFDQSVSSGLNELTSWSGITGSQVTSTSSGRMTISVAGYYHIQVFLNSSSSFLFETEYIYLLVNGVESYGMRSIPSAVISGSYLQGSIIVKLNTSDYISIGFKSTTSRTIGPTYFNTVLIS